jgi:hypothetical protein
MSLTSAPRPELHFGEGGLGGAVCPAATADDDGDDDDAAADGDRDL